MSGNALSLARAGRNPDVVTVWSRVCCFPGNSEVELHAKATRHSIATARKHPSSSHAVPLSDRLHIRLLEGENPSNSVALFVWSPATQQTHFGALAKSAESTHHISVWLSDAVWERLCPPTWKNRFRGSLSISSHQPICRRKMNACWTPDTFVHASRFHPLD